MVQISLDINSVETLVAPYFVETLTRPIQIYHLFAALRQTHFLARLLIMICGRLLGAERDGCWKFGTYGIITQLPSALDPFTLELKWAV